MEQNNKGKKHFNNKNSGKQGKGGYGRKNYSDRKKSKDAAFDVSFDNNGFGSNIREQKNEQKNEQKKEFKNEFKKDNRKTNYGNKNRQNNKDSKGKNNRGSKQADKSIRKEHSDMFNDANLEGIGFVDFDEGRGGVDFDAVKAELIDFDFAPSSKKKVKPDYSGSYGLIESFEAEDRAQEKAVKKVSEKSKNNKADKKFAKNGKSEKNNGRKNKSFDAENESDSSIKTRPGEKYIPFDTMGDFEEDEMYSFYETEEDTGRSKGRKNRTAKEKRRDAAEDVAPGTVVGRNAVRELLRSGRCVDKLYVKSGNREGSIVVIVAEAVNRKIPVVEVSQEKLDVLAGSDNHQGVVALAAEKQYTDIDSILAIAKERGEKPLVVIADGIEDPQNLGALIRCAECAGAHGIIIPKRRASGLTPIVTKASAGAIEHMAIAKVSNLADTIEKLKEKGLWIFAAEAGGTSYVDVDFNVPSAIVFGSEGFGVSRLIKDRADYTVSIPMYGHVNSLNVSAAAAVILCHVGRVQRLK